MLPDTITAIATPIGEGGMAVVRLSGPQAFAIAGRCFKPAGASSKSPADAPTHTLHYGHIAREGVRVDEVMLAVLRAPRTYTREDTVEISCHGGILASKAVLEALLHQGARLAGPGEFTLRAFLNGRIDLAQAEAVADLIHARTQRALATAAEQLSGALSRRINQLRDELMLHLAHIEAYIDFPDEDVHPHTTAQIRAGLQSALDFVDGLLARSAEGQILRRGVRVAILGRPNTGKSSLLNQLLGHDRAIVTPIAGTTRDTIEETADIRGIPVVLVDTAGLRDTTDAIESEGVRRSHECAQAADLILHVLDAGRAHAPADLPELESFAHKPRIFVCNKMDQAAAHSRPNLPGAVVHTCCLDGRGIEALKDALRAAVWSGSVEGDMLPAMINARHQDALRRGREGVAGALAAMDQGEPLEIIAMELRLATQAIGEIVGKTSTEDLLDSIFSQFCIGK